MNNTDKIPFKDREDIVRDPHSKAILKQDLTLQQEYRKQKKLLSTILDSEQRLNKLETKIETVEGMLSKILTILENNK